MLLLLFFTLLPALPWTICLAAMPRQACLLRRTAVARCFCCWLQVVGERSEPAAAKLHLWLERTAFYKVPKSHQDEVSEQCQKPFEQVRLDYQLNARSIDLPSLLSQYATSDMCNRSSAQMVPTHSHVLCTLYKPNFTDQTSYAIER